MPEQDKGIFLGTVGFKKGLDADGNATVSSLAEMTQGEHGLDTVKMQIALSGHKMPMRVIEGADADRVLAEHARNQASTPGSAKSNQPITRGDVLSYNGTRGQGLRVTVLRTNTGNVGRHEVADQKGNRWHTNEKHLTRL